MKDLSHRATLLICFGYDGAPFFGLQPQPGLKTAGGALYDRLLAACQTPPRALAFAARTDRFVHAHKNVATCWIAKEGADTAAIARAVTAPRDDGLVVHNVVVVPPDVHARNVAVAKHYRYLVVARAIVNTAHAWAIAPDVDVDRMRDAAAHLVGTHDFSSLRGGGCTASTPVKTITSIDIARVADTVTIDVRGDAFLRHMVRNLVGVLVEVGSGWRDASTMTAMLDEHRRQAAGLMAPAAGLTLVEVIMRDAVAALL